MVALKPTFRLLLLTRYSILFGLAGPVLIPAAAVAVPDLLGGFLVLESPLQLFNVTWLSLVLALFVLVNFRLIQANASARFSDYRESAEKGQRDGGVEENTIVSSHAQPSPARFSDRAPLIVPRRVSAATHRDVNTTAIAPEQESSPHHPGWRWRWLLLAVIGLSLPFACIYRTSFDLSPQWTAATLSAGTQGALALFGGAVAAMLLLTVFLFTQQLLIDPEAVSCDLLPFESWPLFMRLKQLHLPVVAAINRRLAVWFEKLGPGYTQKSAESGRTVVAPGHTQLALWMTILTVLYFYTYYSNICCHSVPSETGPMSAVCFLLLVMLFLHGATTGLAFLFDYWRAPVLLVLMLLSIGLSSLFNSEHVYELNPPYPDGHDYGQPPPVPELATVFDDWHPPHRTLVVVSAAGGGIQAAAWTTRVLSGLDELYGPEFTRSVGIVSGVSGGSVGLMYYLGQGDWTANGPPLGVESRQRMVASAEASSLEATAWGFAYPDLMRTFVPFLVPRHIDRGWAIEQSWQAQLGDHDVRLRDWIAPIRNHQMPIPVFNAVLAETGQRLLISPVLKKRRKRWPANDACEFFNLYPDGQANPRVTTAARLSATFPYVSPISRADADEIPEQAAKCYHVADGGYAESEGLFTLLDWIGVLLDKYNGDPQNRPFDHILVIRIQPFSVQWRPNPANPNQGWTYDALGPLETITSARGASQSERDSFDLNMAVKNAEAACTADPNKIDIVWTNFMFHPAAEYQPPMSWHLTTNQKQEIEESWVDLVDHWTRPNRPQEASLAPIPNHRKETPLETVEKFFARVTPPALQSSAN